MADAKLAIVFDREGEKTPRFDPGAELSGRAVFTPDAEAKVKSVSFRVHWDVEGGDAAGGEAWSHREDIPDANRVVEAGRTVSWSFRCKLPDSPWSFQGKIISIVWQVSVRLDVPWASDPKASRPFFLHPEVS